MPDGPDQSTSDHGWDVAGNGGLLERAIDVMKALGIRVSLFVDADPAVPAAALAVGADRIELFTGPFGAKFGTAAGVDALNLLSETAEAARAAAESAGRALGLNAGHDLTLENLPAFLEAVPDVAEVSIGHAMIADALSDFRARAEHATMIGDRHFDIEGARANGVRGLGVSWGFGSIEELRGAGADAIASLPHELTTLLGATSEAHASKTRAP